MLLGSSVSDGFFSVDDGDVSAGFLFELSDLCDAVVEVSEICQNLI